MVKIDLSKKPFLLVAKNNNERGYLKLDDGNSLSLSMFDVSGQQIKKGMLKKDMSTEKEEFGVLDIPLPLIYIRR